MENSSTKLEINSYKYLPDWNCESFEGIYVTDNTIKYSDFFENFLLLNKPCLVQNLSNNWACNSDWIINDSLNVDYFIRQFENVEVPVSNCGEREFNVQKKSSMKLYNYLDYWQSYKNSNVMKDCLYLKDWHFLREFPNENIYRVPSYFASDWLNEYYDSASYLNDDYRFVYIGPRGSWTPFHVDVFTSYSWSINICGRKKWILMPPGVEKYFIDNLGNLSYNIDINIIKEKNLQNLPIYFVVQEKGQGLFVPSGWHHQVWNLEDTISINHNWINGCNIHFIWESLKKNLANVKKEISDCQDMENWSSQCQLILTSTFGFNYHFFYSFLVFIANTRLKALKNQESLTVFGDWTFGANHLKFDLKRVLLVLMALKKDSDFIEVHKNETNLNHSFEFIDSLNSFINENFSKSNENIF